MPLYNQLPNWNGLDIQAHPAEGWRKRIRFWPYFVGQKVQLELVIRKPTPIQKEDMQFHIVEKMADEAKPKIIATSTAPDSSESQEKCILVKDASKITAKGEIKYWLSNRGYNVDHEPIFTTEAVSLDTLIIPILLMVLGPILAFLGGLILGCLLG